MFLNQVKTVLLLGVMSGLLFLIGFYAGGTKGLTVALIMGLLMNLISYFWGDKLVLAMYGAQPLDKVKFHKIYEMVEELAHNAGIPMPKLWYLPTPMANAFATGRNPSHASV